MSEPKSFMKGIADSVSDAVSDAVSSVGNSISSLFKKPDSGSAGTPAYRPDSLRGSNDDPDKNSYGHDQQNSAPSASEEFSIDFQPNILDQFDTYTYHWKLFITPLSDAYEGTVLERSAQTIIAETGVTDFTIEKVELHGIAVPSIEAGTGTQTIVRFRIVEPAGAALLDKLYYQSLAIGLGSWLVMPCFLQLEFKGREPDSSESPESGAPGALNGLRWIWPIKLSNGKAHVGHVGSTYDFDAIIYDELAQSDAYFDILHSIILDKLEDTFESVIQRLEKKINDDQLEKYQTGNYGLPDKYKFVLDPVIKKEAKIILPEQHKHTSRHGGDYIDFNKKQASYNPGTSIDKIIDSLLGNTDYFQRKLQSAKTRTARPDDPNEAEPMRKMWRIITETHPYAYDFVRQDNAVEITIYIVEYEIGCIETIAPQTAQTYDTLPAAKKRMNKYKSSKIMKKKYNYIFTGVNDQIIKLDLNMNFSFAAALSRFNGIYYDTAGNDMGVVAQDNSEKEKDLAKYFNERLKQYNSPDFKGDKTVELNAFRASMIAATQKDPLIQERYATVLEDVKNNRHNLESISERAKIEESTRAKRTLTTPNNQGLKFLSDVDHTSQGARDVQDSANALRKGKLRPIPYKEAPQETTLSTGAEPTSDSARARTASVFSTALYSTLDASLQVIKMTIKGDPYWLFPRPVDSNAKALPFKTKMGEAAIDYIKKSHIMHPESVNFFGTDNFIVLRLRTPKIANDSTGLIDRPDDPMAEVETFSGVYKVVTIVNNFENGVFTQELFCILDPIINLQNFLKEIESSSRGGSNSDADKKRQEANQAFRKSEIEDQNRTTSNVPGTAETGTLSAAENRLRQQAKEAQDEITRLKNRVRALNPLGG